MEDVALPCVLSSFSKSSHPLSHSALRIALRPSFWLFSSTFPSTSSLPPSPSPPPAFPPSASLPSVFSTFDPEISLHFVSHLPSKCRIHSRYTGSNPRKVFSGGGSRKPSAMTIRPISLTISSVRMKEIFRKAREGIFSGRTVRQYYKFRGDGLQNIGPLRPSVYHKDGDALRYVAIGVCSVRNYQTRNACLTRDGIDRSSSFVRPLSGLYVRCYVIGIENRDVDRQRLGNGHAGGWVSKLMTIQTGNASSIATESAIQ
jgi:hypothetical protein